MADALIGKVGVDSLPTEILMKIFEYSSTHDILQSYRLVSRAWRDSATTMCRRRHVHFSLTKQEHYIVRRYQIAGKFPKLKNPPWSSIEYNISSGYLGSQLNRFVAEKFAAHVQRLTLNVIQPNYDNMVTVFSKMPRLQFIRICGGYKGNELSQTEVNLNEELSIMWNISSTTWSLSNLKTLEVDFLDSFFLEFLLNIINLPNTSITSLDISLLNGQVPIIEIESLVRMLPEIKIPNITLRLRYAADSAHWRTLSVYKNINIRKLEVESNVNPATGYFQLLSQFLTNCQGLSELYLKGFVSATPSRTPPPVDRFVKIPALSNLHTLQIELMDREDHEANTKFHVEVVPLKPQQFPQLRRVTLLTTPLIFSHASIFREVFEVTDCCFEAVQEFEVTDYGDDDEWAKVFPNLNRLEATVADSGAVIEIFQNMFHLKELALTINAIDGKNANSILFENFNTTPFVNVKAFTGLKKLTLIGYKEEIQNGDCLSDSGAILLMLLDPLDLTIENAKLSDQCIAQLCSYHRRFQLL